MTRIVTNKPEIAELDAFIATLDNRSKWDGDMFGINLLDIMQYARDGLRERDNNFAFADEMEARYPDLAIVHPNELTEEQCQQCLIEMDKEGAEFYKGQKDGFKGALQDNLNSFGDHQIGNVVLKADKPTESPNPQKSSTLHY